MIETGIWVPVLKIRFGPPTADFWSVWSKLFGPPKMSARCTVFGFRPPPPTLPGSWHADNPSRIRWASSPSTICFQSLCRPSELLMLSWPRGGSLRRRPRPIIAPLHTRAWYQRINFDCALGWWVGGCRNSSSGNPPLLLPRLVAADSMFRLIISISSLLISMSSLKISISSLKISISSLKISIYVLKILISSHKISISSLKILIYIFFLGCVGGPKPRLFIEKINTVR